MTISTYSVDDNLGWDNEDIELPQEWWDDLPKTMFWRILVMPLRPRTKSKGGIELPRSVQDAQTHLNYVGKIVGMGGMAGRDKRLANEVNFPRVGEYIIYSRYAGQPVLYKGIKLLFLNDDEILAKVSDPAAMQVNI